MNRSEEIPEFIFDLIGTKTFDELSSQEKEHVLTYMTREEYLVNSAVIDDFKKIDAQLQFEEAPPMVEQEYSLSQSKKIVAFSYLQIAASAVLLISLGFGFGRFLSQQPDGLPIAIEEDKPEVTVSQPVYMNVKPVNAQATEMQLQKIEQLTEQVIEDNGSSLEEDNYPEDLVVRI